MNEPRRHHLVPRFLLNRFAKGEKIAMVKRDNPADVIVTSTKNAAVQTDFYTVELADGSRSNEIEHLLSTVEGEAATAIKSIDKGEFPFTNETKERLAAFMAFQVQRGRDSRDSIDQAASEILRMMMRVAPSEFVRQTLQDQGKSPTEDEVAKHVQLLREHSDEVRVNLHQNDHIEGMLQAVPQYLPYFLDRGWNLVRFSAPQLLSGDRPVALWRRPDPVRPWLGVGLENADEILFPLDPRQALVLTGYTRAERLFAPALNKAHGINSLVAHQAYKWIYHCPTHQPLSGVKLRPRGPMVTSGLGPRKKAEAGPR